MSGCVGARSGRLDRFQGDLVAKPFELADELTLVVLGGLALLEVVVAQLLEATPWSRMWSAITRTEWATAMVALPGPRRPRRRWYWAFR
jgi:hypothetical protein